MNTIPMKLSMRAMVAIFGALLFCVPLFGQSALSIGPERCVWRQGDDVSWAAPGLDESGWHPTTAWTNRATPTPFFWLRCQFNAARLDRSVQPALQVSGDLAWQVYADGKLISESGNLATGAHTAGVEEELTAPELARRDGPIAVAVRMTFTPAYNGQQMLPRLALGDAEFQRSAYYSEVYRRMKAQWVTWVCYALITSAGLFFLALYWFDRTQHYVLWVSLVWLSLADLRINEFLIRSSTHFPARLEFFLYAIGQTVPLFVTLFYFTLNRRRLPKIYLAIQWLYAFYPTALVVAAFLPLQASMEVRYWVEMSFWMGTLNIVLTLAVVTASPVSFWPFGALRGWQIPLACACLVEALMDTVYVGVQLPIFNLDANALFVKIQPYRSAAIALVVVSLTLLLVQRVRSTNRERAALHGEMQAARQIQRLLVPARLDTASGWTVDTAFLPAREVGGDFYRCCVLPNGQERILIGDVSGKGAAAAMTAAMLVGAAEDRVKDSPAELLAHLNRVFTASGIGGFATCLCAHLTPEGDMTVANAGHLAPYIDGREVELPPALPLGFVQDGEYAEVHVALVPGARLTFLSDGVVEARNAEGELFGFERAAALSVAPADHVARAAQAFGQEDDITVLAVTRLEAGAMALAGTGS
jgi:sigma-B regulation protein RsbU (phosphoserine phosphatase)